MNDPITIKGLWWLPDQPKKQLSGEITYGPVSGAKLSLLDYFFNEATRDSFTVWGMTVRGRPITLFHCHASNLTMHLPGARVAEVSSYFGIVGGHFKSPDQMQFVKVAAKLSHLHEWAWTTGITVEHKEKAWQVSQKMLPDILLGSRGNFKMALEFTGHLSPGFGDCKLSESCSLILESQSLTAYADFEEIIHKLQHFVALAICQPVYALSITAQIDKPKQVIQGHSIFEEFEIIRKVSVTKGKKESLIPHDMQFCLADLQPNPSDHIQRFFDKYKLLNPVCDLYFSTLYNQDMYVQQRFLALAHAIEAYHRAFFGGKYQSDDDYRNGLQKILRDAIPVNINADFKASLKNKLKYLHEFSLRKRVQDICEKFNAVAKPFLGEASQFANDVADQRNRLTHPDSTAENNYSEKDWKGIWLKGEQLGLLLEICLLHELGFDEKAISKMLSRNRRTSAIQQNR
jgi:hypothetical protein